MPGGRERDDDLVVRRARRGVRPDDPDPGDDGSGRPADGERVADADVEADLVESGDDADGASRTAFAVVAAMVTYLCVSYGLLLFPSMAAVAESGPVLLVDTVAYVVLTVATFVDATRVRRAGTWSPRRWVWVPLVAVPLLDLLTGPAYLLVRYWRT